MSRPEIHLTSPQQLRRQSETRERGQVGAMLSLAKSGNNNMNLYLVGAEDAEYTVDCFTKMEAVWTAVAQDHSNDLGKQAYALKTANMYWQMHEDAEKKFADVGGTWPSAGVSLAQHIRSKLPDVRIDWDAGVAENN
ncbi:hypothetical protein DFH08DRAFT_824090 [Mycena albidolilacea]|uniref:Uncharacterized protein n=1 Tax=Mycena albidolilacea TaxID=1033008 RepID=A0AAD6Z555_9AGAR|nr:hypothetical protein DFH08DRAFT_824090 [Mycena albidolilacea]